MIDLEQQAEARSSSNRPDIWSVGLAVVAVLFVLVGVLPWERWCNDPAGRCFHAAVWSGSGQLFGLLAEILAATFVVVFVTRRWWRASLSGAAVALAAGFLTAGAVKAIFVSNNGSMYLAAESPPSPVAFGVALGTVVVLVGSCLVLVVVGRSRRPLRAAAAGLGVAMVLVALSIPYAAAGLGWWGGPLAPPAFLGGGNAMGFTLQPGQSETFSDLLDLQDAGRLGLTLDGLDFVASSPRLRLLGSYVVVNGCPRGARRLPGSRRECGYPMRASTFSRAPTEPSPRQSRSPR